MRLLKFLLGIYCIFCFMACESDDLEIQGSQGANKTEKKKFEYL